MCISLFHFFNFFFFYCDFIFYCFNVASVRINVFINVLSGGAGNVDSLFQSVDHVSRAVGTLVNIMTDDEAADVRAVPPSTGRAGPSRSTH